MLISALSFMQALLRAYPRAAIVDQSTTADIDKDWLRTMNNLDPFFSSSAGDGAEFESKTLLETELSMFADGIAFNPYEVTCVLQLLRLLRHSSSCANSVFVQKHELAFCNCKFI